MIETIRANARTIAIAVGSVSLLVALVLLVGGEEPVDDPQTFGTTAPETTLTTTTSDEPTSDHPDVPPVTCNRLIDLEDIDEAFDMVGEFPSFFVTASGESCTHTFADDERLTLRIEPGHPSDFDPGAQLGGFNSVPVAGVGEGAVWFGSAEGDTSSLSVQQTTDFGTLIFRITIRRPGADGATQLEKLKGVALAVLPRFPGVELERPDTVLIEFTAEPVDVSNVSFEANLLAKQEAGEWTYEEGLVATLQSFTGESDTSQVLRHSELVDASGSQVVRMAQEYLVIGEDPEAKAEIVRLLERLFPPEELLGDLTDSAVEAMRARGLMVSLGGFIAQETTTDYCLEEYGVPSPCFDVVTSQTLNEQWPGQFVIYRPKSSVESAWTDANVTLWTEALEASALKYQGLVKMPNVVILLAANPDSPGHMASSYQSGLCQIDIWPSAIPLPGNEKRAQQFLAAHIADCLIDHTMSDPTGWWRNALRTYLSGYVYPEVNLEHKLLPLLQATELARNMIERDYTNWAFFEWKHPDWGPDGILSFVDALPETLGSFEAEWHAFAQDLTDNEIPDQNPDGDTPYPNPPHEAFEISVPTLFTANPKPCCDAGGLEGAPSIVRAQLVVPIGQKACISYETDGDVQATWRTGVVGASGGSWDSELPEELNDVSVFVVTATGADAELTMNVEDVIDDSEDCSEAADPAGGPSEGPDDCQVLTCGPSEYYWVML